MKNIEMYLNQDINNPTYLFHGSPKKLDKVVPKLSHDSDSNQNNIAEAVFLFPSLIKSSAYAFKDTIKEFSKGLKWNFVIPNDNELPIMIMENVNIDEDITGYIYVFKNDGTAIKDKGTSLQYKSYQELIPIDIIEIKYKDFKNYYVIRDELSKRKNIRVGGKAATLDKEFENYDYISTYKESALPLSVTAAATLRKIGTYKQNKDQILREEIISDNMRLVTYVAYRYAIYTNINQHELESYGYEGLILALENFDVSYGCNFSTYAIAYIRNYILKGIQEILIGKRDKFYFDYVNAKVAVEKECGITLSEAPELVEDVIDLLIATGKIKDDERAREYVRMRIKSLAIGDVSLNDEETVEELIASNQLVDTRDYEEEVLNTMSRETIERLLDTLPVRDAEILRLRFGFYDGTPKTFGEIAMIVGLTNCRIQQIVDKAIKKLRRSSRLSIIKDCYDFDVEKYGDNKTI